MMQSASVSARSAARRTGAADRWINYAAATTVAGLAGIAQRMPGEAACPHRAGAGAAQRILLRRRAIAAGQPPAALAEHLVQGGMHASAAMRMRMQVGAPRRAAGIGLLRFVVSGHHDGQAGAHGRGPGA